MITETTPSSQYAVQYAVKVNGAIVASNLPSKQIAENVIFNLPPDQRAIAIIETMTATGQILLFD